MIMPHNNKLSFSDDWCVLSNTKKELLAATIEIEAFKLPRSILGSTATLANGYAPKTIFFFELIINEFEDDVDADADEDKGAFLCYIFF